MSGGRLTFLSPSRHCILTLRRTAQNVREDLVKVPEMGKRSACYYSLRKAHAPRRAQIKMYYGNFRFVVEFDSGAVAGLVPRYVSMMETQLLSQEALAVKNTIVHAMSELGQRLLGLLTGFYGERQTPLPCHLVIQSNGLVQVQESSCAKGREPATMRA
jgi:hypothetical protein